VSYSTKDVQSVLSGQKYPAADNDNIAEGVLDAMTQADVWGDNKPVARLEVAKRYAAVPKCGQPRAWEWRATSCGAVYYLKRDALSSTPPNRNRKRRIGATNICYAVLY
jgi:hypothetical protein